MPFFLQIRLPAADSRLADIAQVITRLGNIAVDRVLLGISKGNSIVYSILPQVGAVRSQPKILIFSTLDGLVYALQYIHVRTDRYLNKSARGRMRLLQHWN